MVTQTDALLALQREFLFFFVWKAFGHLHPAQEFGPHWHIRAICHALMKVAVGETTRLLITVPPRYGKSICASVALPAWMLGIDPALKIIVASYGGDLATKHSRDFRDVLNSDWYRALFPTTRIKVGGNRLDEQLTTRNGSRKAVSLGSAVTGFGADLIILDDPLKAADASSPTERQRVLDYYQTTLLSRLNDKVNGRIIVVQQRLHEDDLPGHLIDSGQFEHLDLPAIAVEDSEIAIGHGQLKYRRKGEVLCPEREPAEALERLRLEMGNFAFSAQYQQDPTPAEGNRVRLGWFGQHELYDAEPSEFQTIVQSWDTAVTAEPTSDFSVGMTWGMRDGNWYLLDLIRERMEFPQLRRRVPNWADRWQAQYVLIELANSGTPLWQQLRHEDRAPWRFFPIKPLLDKLTRLEAQTGRYHLPTTAPWLTDLRRELLAFPAGRHDDQVDCLVQFIEWSASPRGMSMVDRDPETGRPRRVNRPSRVRRHVS
jgi:predicted phage terminase large subunit-like protein